MQFQTQYIELHCKGITDWFKIRLERSIGESCNHISVLRINTCTLCAYPSAVKLFSWVATVMLTLKSVETDAAKAADKAVVTDSRVSPSGIGSVSTRSAHEDRGTTGISSVASTMTTDSSVCVLKLSASN